MLKCKFSKTIREPAICHASQLLRSLPAAYVHTIVGSGLTIQVLIISYNLIGHLRLGGIWRQGTNNTNIIHCMKIGLIRQVLFEGRAHTSRDYCN